MAHDSAEGATGKLYWFDAVDEPQKAPASEGQYELENSEANWGIWHFTPNNPSDAFGGSGLWGTFAQKHSLPWQTPTPAATPQREAARLALPTAPMA